MILENTNLWLVSAKIASTDGHCIDAVRLVAATDAENAIRQFRYTYPEGYSILSNVCVSQVIYVDVPSEFNAG